ncbi:MAG: hypothetical protein J6T57_03520 [Alphaproteobacteria bacterium]|nr:hypothetical protein [Alphaproteobacteria bacterium]
MKKMSLEEMVKKIDDSKKVNPLDLSSDQDLSIALMNLVSLEEHFFFSGAKTKKPGFYDLINTVREMRKELMSRIVDKNAAQGAEVWCISKHLLAASMRLYEVGTKALGVGNKKDAYAMFEKAYELYSLFWGLNMQMIDLAGVKKMEPELYDAAVSKGEEKKSKSVKMSESKSTVRRLGDWVKNAVNCCIE